MERFFTVTGIGVLVALMTVLGSPNALASTAQAVQCGDTLTASVRLDADLNCTGTALTIAAGDVTVDLGGHTVVGTTSGISAQGQAGVAITNGTVGGGISLTQVPSSTLSNLHLDSLSVTVFSAATITDSVIQNGKIALQGDISLVRCQVIGVRTQGMSSGIKMSDSTVTDSRFITNATNYTLTGNTLTRSSISGDENGGEIATENRFVQSGMDFFIADHVDIENNQFSGAGSGLSLDDTVRRNGVIKGNVFDGGQVGLDINSISFERINNVTVSHNVFVDNSAAGMVLSGGKLPGSNPIAISDNVFVSNGKGSSGPVNDGLYVHVPAASPVTISDNFTLNNADHGIEAQPGTVIDGGGNISVGDPAGCLGVVCQ